MKTQKISRKKLIRAVKIGIDKAPYLSTSDCLKLMDVARTTPAFAVVDTGNPRLPLEYQCPATQAGLRLSKPYVIDFACAFDVAIRHSGLFGTFRLGRRFTVMMITYE